MKSSLFTLAFIALSASQIFAQSPIAATARIFENSSKDASKIFVVYEDGTEETIQLFTLPGLGMARANPNVLKSNQKKIQQFLKDMEGKGYEVSNISSSSEGFIYTFIIFKKKEQ